MVAVKHSRSNGTSPSHFLSVRAVVFLRRFLIIFSCDPQGRRTKNRVVLLGVGWILLCRSCRACYRADRTKSEGVNFTWWYPW